MRRAGSVLGLAPGGSVQRTATCPAPAFSHAADTHTGNLAMCSFATFSVAGRLEALASVPGALLSRVEVAGCSGRAWHETTSDEGQIVPTRLVGAGERDAT